MARMVVDPQPDLFEKEDPPFTLSPDQRKQLLSLVMAMLIEIATASTRTEGEVSDDEEHA